MDAERAVPLLAGPTAGATSCPNAAAPSPSSMTTAMAAIENGFFMLWLSLGWVVSATAWLPSRITLLPAGARWRREHT